MIRPMPTDNGSLESDIERLERPTPLEEFLANGSQSASAFAGRPAEFYSELRDSLLQDINQSLSSLQENNGELKAKVDRQSASLYSLLNKSRQIDDRNRLLQAALDEHKQKASAASSQLVSSEAQHKQEKETLAQHAYELETRVKQLEESNAALQEALDKLKTAGPDASAAAPQADGELDEPTLLKASILNAEHSTCKLQISKLTSERADTMRELSKLKDELAKLSEELAKAQADKTPLEDEVQQLRADLDSATQTIESHMATIEQQKQRNKSLADEVYRLHTELEEASSKTAHAMNSLHMSRSMCLARASSSLSGASAADGASILNTSATEIEVLLDAPDGDGYASHATSSKGASGASRKRGQTAEVQTEASESKRVDAREAATSVGDSLSPAVTKETAAASAANAAALAELEAKLRAREVEQKQAVSKLELQLRTSTIEIATLRKNEADLRATIAKYVQQLKQEQNNLRPLEQENIALKAELTRVGQLVSQAQQDASESRKQNDKSVQSLAQKDRNIEKLEAHVRELAMKIQELEPKASQMELYKAQMETFQKDFNLQKMSTEQAEAKSKRISEELEHLKKETTIKDAEWDRLRAEVERLTLERDNYSTSYMNALQLLDETNQAAGRRVNQQQQQQTMGGPRPRLPAPPQANPRAPASPPAASSNPLYPRVPGGQQTTAPETLITCPFCKKLLPDHQSLQIHVADEHDQ